MASKMGTLMTKKIVVSVIGPNDSAATDAIIKFGEQLGAALAGEGYVICCGGMGGLMAAVCRGAKEAFPDFFGTTMGILPGKDASEANEWCDLAIPTGLGVARNTLVVQTGEVAIAVGGGAGTLSEIALAWQLGKKIICINHLGGWSGKLAGQILDPRRDEAILSANTIEEVLALIRE
jgi:hypothetical protein